MVLNQKQSKREKKRSWRWIVANKWLSLTKMCNYAHCPTTVRTKLTFPERYELPNEIVIISISNGDLYSPLDVQLRVAQEREI